VCGYVSEGRQAHPVVREACATLSPFHFLLFPFHLFLLLPFPLFPWLLERFFFFGELLDTLPRAGLGWEKWLIASEMLRGWIIEIPFVSFVWG
jgi:hypothetical protein